MGVVGGAVSDVVERARPYSDGVGWHTKFAERFLYSEIYIDSHTKFEQ